MTFIPAQNDITFHSHFVEKYAEENMALFTKEKVWFPFARSGLLERRNSDYKRLSLNNSILIPSTMKHKPKFFTILLENPTRKSSGLFEPGEH